MAKKRAAPRLAAGAKRKKAKPKRPSKRALGPKAIAQAAKKKTDRARPGRRTGEDERIAVRRNAAMSARVQGANYSQIAEQLGCSVGTAYEDVAAEMTAVCADTRMETEQNRDLELERCDLVLRSFRAGMLRGEAPAGRVFIRAIELRAKLHGLIKQTVVKPEDEIHADLTEREVAMRVAALVKFSRTPRRGERVH